MKSDKKMAIERIGKIQRITKHLVARPLLAQARMPEGFLEGLRGAITPGATILVTDAPVLPDTTGLSLTVMTSDGPGTK